MGEYIYIYIVITKQPNLRSLIWVGGILSQQITLIMKKLVNHFYCLRTKKLKSFNQLRFLLHCKRQRIILMFIRLQCTTSSRFFSIYIWEKLYPFFFSFMAARWMLPRLVCNSWKLLVFKTSFYLPIFYSAMYHLSFQINQCLEHLKIDKILHTDFSVIQNTVIHTEKYEILLTYVVGKQTEAIVSFTNRLFVVSLPFPTILLVNITMNKPSFRTIISALLTASAT